MTDQPDLDQTDLGGRFTLPGTAITPNRMGYGAVRGQDASWNPAMAPDELASAVRDNLRNLGLDALDVVNLRMMGGGAGHGPSEGSIEEPLTALAELDTIAANAEAAVL